MASDDEHIPEGHAITSFAEFLVDGQEAEFLHCQGCHGYQHACLVFEGYYPLHIKDSAVYMLDTSEALCSFYCCCFCRGGRGGEGQFQSLQNAVFSIQLFLPTVF